MQKELIGKKFNEYYEGQKEMANLVKTSSSYMIFEINLHNIYNTGRI